MSGQVASVGAFNRAKLRLVAAYGRSDGSALGRLADARAVRDRVRRGEPTTRASRSCSSTPAATGLSTIERPWAGSSARRRRFRRPAPSRLRSQSTRTATASSPGSAPGASRRASATPATGWGSVLQRREGPRRAKHLAAGRGDPRRQLHPGVGRRRHPREPARRGLSRGPPSGAPGRAGTPTRWRTRTLGNERRASSRRKRNGVAARDRATAQSRSHGPARWPATSGSACKAARLTSSGLRPFPARLGRRAERRARRRGGRARAVRRRSSGRSSTRPDPHPHVRRAVARTGRLVRAARSADAGRRNRHGGPCPWAFQTITGQAVAMVPIIQGNSGGFAISGAGAVARRRAPPSHCAGRSRPRCECCRQARLRGGRGL